jgi:hypothetical protein
MQVDLTQLEKSCDYTKWIISTARVAGPKPCSRIYCDWTRERWVWGMVTDQALKGMQAILNSSVWTSTAKSYYMILRWKVVWLFYIFEMISLVCRSGQREVSRGKIIGWMERWHPLGSSRWWPGWKGDRDGEIWWEEECLRSKVNNLFVGSGMGSDGEKHKRRNTKILD